MTNVDYSAVEIRGGFWKKKQELVKNTTVHAVYDRFKETHRFDALSCKWREGDPDMPHVFWDSDVAKWIEGAAYILKFERNKKLEDIIDDAVSEIIRNSDENGYFNSHFLVTEQNERFKNRSKHELYCAGHLMEAAVAYYEATGKNAFLKSMCRYADYIERIFKTEDSAAFTTPGHPELELALMRLYKATGVKRYAELSKYFIDQRGNGGKDLTHGNNLPAYYQDERPLKELTEPVGHAVRALYLLCGMADVGIEFKDDELLNACRRCYESLTEKRMYITGGVGSSYLGEAFTADYHLPNRTAYCETCAAISVALFCQRMLGADNNAKYADTIERVIFNGILSGLSMSGDSFFYENPLEIDLDFNDVDKATPEKERYPITRRMKVFEVSCCPPNLVRFISSIGGYIYGYDDDTVFINQFIDSALHIDGTDISMQTEYPKDGKVSIKCDTDKKRLAVRIPAWCKSFKANADHTEKDGYMVFTPCKGQNISIEFDMPVVAVQSNPAVHENAGRIAVTRGPVIYCAEAVDNGPHLKSMYIDPCGEFTLGDHEFILPKIKTTAFIPENSRELYYKADDRLAEKELTLIPYYAFANRDESSMLVWFLKK